MGASNLVAISGQMKHVAKVTPPKIIQILSSVAGVTASSFRLINEPELQLLHDLDEDLVDWLVSVAFTSFIILKRSFGSISKIVCVSFGRVSFKIVSLSRRRRIGTVILALGWISEQCLLYSFGAAD